ncbi:L,D-transpeptidase family protein [Nocardioides speluncae]|uniref:L,D-transpeptidase family protein n=1 Tax=Nocardioides speluncae TaxID=2670337 RepID=UPI001F0C510A|nr:peptidoglycan-binding protein [Nocardioides speluncae]
MKALRALALMVMTVCLLSATAFGASYAIKQFDDGSKPASSGTPSASPSDGGTEPSNSPEPPFSLRSGDKGEEVRELQHRLFQLQWLPELTTGVYDGTTVEAVKGFQGKRGLKATGAVDQKTWDALVKMTKAPTRDQKFNVLKAGATLHGPGASGDDVRAVQARLKQIDWYAGDVTGTYDAATVTAVKGFQEKREIPVTGNVDQRTLDRLVAMTYEPTHEEMYNIEPQPGALDPRCGEGRALCVDKTTQSMRWVIDGKVQSTYDVRFGSAELPTREGAFSVYLKSRDHVSKLYGTSMPFAMFFSGGQAVHYSPDFAANGYNGASHGCANIRDYDGMAWLFDQVNVGDKVIVYWS